MNSGWYVTASDIKHWTNTKGREAAGLLPMLIMRLLYASCKPKEIHFPSHDSISTDNYDGILEVEFGSEFIPSGKSVWEISTEKAVGTQIKNILKFHRNKASFLAIYRDLIIK